MKFFNRRRPRKIIARKDPTLDKVLEKALIRHAKEDPEWAFRAATRKFGIQEDPVDPVEELKKQKLAELLENDPEFAESVKAEYLAQSRGSRDLSSAIDEEVTEAALAELHTNPELMHKAVSRRINEIVVGHGESEDGSSLVKLLQELDNLEELKGRLGGDRQGGILTSLLSPEVLKKVIEVLPSLLGKQSGEGVQQQRVYVVETPKGALELDAAGYKKYLEEKQRTALAEPRATAPSGIMEEWLPYLDKPPEDFVDALVQKQQEGNPTASLVLNLLASNTADNILAILQPYKKDYAEAIEKLEANREWLEGAITYLQRLIGEQQHVSGR